MPRGTVLLVWMLGMAVCAGPVGAGERTELASAGLVGRFLLIPAVKVYRHVMAPFMMHRCPSYPHCSEYAIQAVKTHGAFLGWFMAVDRLIHEASEMDRGGTILVDRSTRLIYDPLHYNDFWWKRPPGRIGPKEAESIAETLLP